MEIKLKLALLKGMEYVIWSIWIIFLAFRRYNNGNDERMVDVCMDSVVAVFGLLLSLGSYYYYASAEMHTGFPISALCGKVGVDLCCVYIILVFVDLRLLIMGI
ncbi:hypothetical protein MKX03_002747 [Papaver bracteatum]|nr:hypothetical protein MKX03_008862 [Papaver bracteatum]KAI3887343.1 hypothetical protein MKX03_002747 [Papaver bracteatum]